VEINVLIDEGLAGHLEVGWLRGIAEQVLVAQKTGAGVELGLVITDQEKVRQLNRSYRGRDELTDVLAFALLPEPLAAGAAAVAPFVPPPDGLRHLGEVIIAYPQAVEQAKEHHHSVKKEMAILIVHGVLHLLGYDHDRPEAERQMKEREAAILSGIKGGLA